MALKSDGIFETLKAGLKQPYLLLILFCSMLVFVPFLVSGAGLWDTWEPKYAETSRSMLEQREWLVPAFRGIPRFTKPILIYWLQIIGMKLFGVGEFSLRLPGVLLSIAFLAFLYRSISKLYSKKTGFLASMILLTCPSFFLLSIRTTPDIILTIFSGAAMGLILPALEFKERRNLYLVVSYGMIALSVLAKGPVGLVFPASGLLFVLFGKAAQTFGNLRRDKKKSFIFYFSGISLSGIGSLLLFFLLFFGATTERLWDVRGEIVLKPFRDQCAHLLGQMNLIHASSPWTVPLAAAVFLLLLSLFFGFMLYRNSLAENARRSVRRFAAHAAILIGILALVSGWYFLWMIRLYGSEYTGKFFIHGHVDRFFTSFHDVSAGSYFYLKVLIFGLFPWTGFAFYAICRNLVRKETVSSRTLFLSGWIILPVIFFTLARTKFPFYIAPVLPAFAVLTAPYLSSLFERRMKRIEFLILFGLFLIPLALLAKNGFFDYFGTVVVDYQYPYEKEFPFVVLVLVLSTVFIAGAATKLAEADWKGILQKFLLPSALAVAFSISAFLYPAICNFQSPKNQIRTCSRLVDGRPGIVFLYLQVHPAVVFYLQRQYQTISSSQDAELLFRSGNAQFCIVRQADLVAFRTLLRERGGGCTIVDDAYPEYYCVSVAPSTLGKENRPDSGASLDVKPPRILKFKQAVYPKECIREGIRGMVILEVSIDKDGKAIRARVISSPDPRLSRAAAEAVKDYEFSPALVGGKPVESRMLLKVYF